MTPHRIAAVTFTNRAAREMRERLALLLGPGVQDLTASTYHAFCSMVLRRESERIGLARDYSIYDAADQIDAALHRVPAVTAELIASLVRVPLLAAQLATSIIAVPFLAIQLATTSLGQMVERMDG